MSFVTWSRVQALTMQIFRENPYLRLETLAELLTTRAHEAMAEMVRQLGPLDNLLAIRAHESNAEIIRQLETLDIYKSSFKAWDSSMKFFLEDFDDKFWTEVAMEEKAIMEDEERREQRIRDLRKQDEIALFRFQDDVFNKRLSQKFM